MQEEKPCTNIISESLYFILIPSIVTFYDSSTDFSDVFFEKFNYLITSYNHTYRHLAHRQIPDIQLKTQN